ncbi:MAG: HAD-IB family hydrolase [Victivallaceae bacterium]|nr:HAD-IB family hydrolase [Victivallaceae bacterium]
MIALAVFDMDNTLIGCDCDLTWKRFVVSHGLAPESALAEADAHMADYDLGKLDEEKFLDFQLREFRGSTPGRMAELAELHFKEVVLPRCRRSALAEVSKLKASGVAVWMLTSTCSVIAAPVATYFGFDAFHGAELEIDGGLYTGRTTGIYPSGPGKVKLVRDYAESLGVRLEETAAYGDSVNDLQLLEGVGFPYAVSPSAGLAAAAAAAGWPVLDWRMKGERDA